MAGSQATGRQGRWALAGLGAAALVAVGWWASRPAPEAPAWSTPLAWVAVSSLLAGDGLAGLVDGPRLQARLDEPWGLARDGAWGLYVSDAGNNNRIRHLAADGSVRSVAGSGEGFADGPAAQARLHTPSALALAADGSLLIADTGNHAIRVLADGQLRTLAGNGQRGQGDGPALQARFDAPMGVAWAADGRVYVADTWNDRIALIERDGQVRTLAGGNGPGLVDGPGLQASFDTPTALLADPDGGIWVADTGNHALRRVHADGRVETVAGGEGQPVLHQPVGLARTDDGVLYISEHASGRVLQRSPAGHLAVVFGEAGGQRLSRPAGISLAPGGGLLLADAGSGRLHWLHPAADRTPRLDGDIGPAPLRALPATAGRWPLAPQHGWHEVVGTLGEVRGTFAGKNRNHLHAGFDVRGDVGQTVLAIADGKVSHPLAAWSPNGQAEGLALGELDYIHMRVGRSPGGQALDPRFELLRDQRGRVERVRLRRGTRFAPGDALGTINAQAHVHLQAGPGAYKRNAVGLGFVNFTDSVAPVIEGIALLDDAEQPLRRHEDGRLLVERAAMPGGVQIAVHARDQVDGNLARRRLGLYALGYQILDAAGRPLPGHEQPLMNLEFNRMPPQGDAVLHAYGPESGITVHGSAVTRFQYLVTNTVRDGRLQGGRWMVDGLVPGDYSVRITARDWHGNAATAGRDLPVRLR